MIERDIFEDLFVLEMTNNHQGKLERGLEIIRQHSRIARFNNVRAAIKLQFRDVDKFVHKDFRARTDIRYINRISQTRLPREDYATLVETIRKSGCIPMATPFDESSVDLCVEFGLPIIKIASADCNDWQLIEKIATTRKPVIVSVGGASLKDTDDMVAFFEKREIPLAINHCIATYPHSAYDCELNQIDFLKHRYPSHTIGYSTHEEGSASASVMLAYAKGARTFERHIDISDGSEISKYSTLPEQVDTWFKAWQQAKIYCGSSNLERKLPLSSEVAYLDSYIRGIYANRDLKEGELLHEEDIYLAIPLQKGQISTRELMLGQYGHRMTKACAKDKPILIDMIDTPYAENEALKGSIYQRGV
jgi:N-acetylneuraminate synthase